MEKIHEIKSVVRDLPEKKRYAEFISAVLSVPVLLTVLMMNINNLRNKPAANVAVPQTTSTPAPTTTIKHTPTHKIIAPTNTPNPTVLPTPTNTPTPTQTPTPTFTPSPTASPSAGL